MSGWLSGWFVRFDEEFSEKLKCFEKYRNETLFPFSIFHEVRQNNRAVEMMLLMVRRTLVFTYSTVNNTQFLYVHGRLAGWMAGKSRNIFL